MALLAALVLSPTLTQADVVTLSPAADTFIVSSAANNNAGAQPGLTAGTDGNGGIRRSLVRFDLGGIPAGSTVTSAVLRLTVITVPGFGAVDSSFDLLRLQAAWGEGNKVSGFPNSGAPATAGEATWNARLQGTANWTAPGALSDAAGTPSATVAVSGLGTYSWTGASVVADVQTWLETPAQNYGWLLVSQAEGSLRSAREFGSRETLSQPALEVGYTPPPASNTPPFVNIIAPTNGASFTAPAMVLIQAVANDVDGSVTNVEFFDGATSLGSDASGPDYSVSANLFPGNHTLTAVATDDEGATQTSLPVNVTVGNTIITDPFAERVPKGSLTIELQTMADGMASPLGMADPADGSGRLFVYDQDGRVWIVTAAGRSGTPLLDIRSRLVTLGAYDERGLLGFTLHPDFPQNGKLYTYSSETLAGAADFTNGLGATNNHHSVIAEWQISAANSNAVDVASRREVMRIDQPQSNHNGGAMRFGPDGNLYVVLGDGGQAHDAGLGHVPGGNGQDPNNIWGTMIRIDVDGTNAPNGQYSVPGDNPFVGTNGLDEIFAYGFRNPFSFSFDRMNGDIYLGDVGQGKVEEVDIVTAGGNYGWNIREGSFWFDGTGNLVAAPVRPVPPGLIDPIAMYDHDDGLAIIGGFVYRGTTIGALAGTYVFGDWGSFNAPSGRLYYLDATNGVKEFRLGVEDRPLGQWIKGWGEDANGELYVFTSRMLGPSGATGRMLKLVPAPDPVEITQVSPSGDNVQVNWSGGSGPYAIQRQATLGEPLWMDDSLTVPTTQAVSAAGQSGFFRVFDTAHQPAIPLSAYLTGDAERPTPVVTSATGLGLFSLDGNTLTFSLSYTGLSGPATAAHIHGPASVDVAGGVLINLAPYAGAANSAAGTYSGVLVLTDSQKALILSGQTYVNIHTAANSPGEIRGQIAPVLMQLSLNGANERPNPVTTPGNGLGTVTLVGNQLSLNVTYAGLTAPATMAHIHGPADMTTSAGVLVNLAGLVDGALGTQGSYSGTLTLSPAHLLHVISGRTYINIHTGTNPGGEIRGQILPKPTAVPLTAALSGLNERPTPVTNSATGSATLMLKGNTLTFNLQYEGLSGPATAAHIHGPAPASGSAGVLINLAPFNGGTFSTNGTLSGSVVLTPAQRAQVLGGQTYVNIHTAANTGGEIRGQLAVVLMTSHLSGGNERPAANNSLATGLGLHTLVGNQLTQVVTYNHLTTSATMAHIHGPAGAFQSAGVLVDLAPLSVGPFAVSGALRGSVTLTPNQVGYLVDGLTYVNIHSATYGSGEIRGQILR